ncbi:parathyroid hormone/parathyroid hormone-related peptide receptor-like isoform X2 [Athalia rosae]|uniref:parathyroid hormone/parathyroid hormone-related peptide receptor-like isoform X2 n=1 Tax=Athalia rosae TaxID=37344 RepID=UPI0006262FA8|nr:parathyroid hormone/parathyroid hormone-related peptide receptor-like isoform X2 [Athalia rosae]
MSIDFNSPIIQEQMMQQQAKKCHNGSMTNQGWCPEIWDGILCWPSTSPNAVSTLICPHYIAGFVPANATRSCMADGNWFWNADTNSTWSNYTQCYSAPLVKVLMDLPTHHSNVTLSGKYISVVKTISAVGYSVSLSTLIVAFCILATIKKLRCPRNMLHMHLFASFMTRAFIAILKHPIFPNGIGLSSDVLVTGDESYWLADAAESNWQCKAFTSVWQYFILANYSWILMEGLYLHNLVFLALFTDSNSSIAGYVILGWGLPAIFVLPWVAVRAALEDTYCWTTHINPLLFLIIRVPTMLSILINFVLFINIVRVLLSKLRSTVSEETQRYKRWARSTLVLVPLFGVHYTVFLGMSYGIASNEVVETVWLFCDQLFASFQGFFVAVLYCFLNGEVRAEVSRTWRGRKWPRFHRGRWGPRPSTQSCSTCSGNAIKLNKKPKNTKWWNEPWTCCCCTRRSSVNRSTHSMANVETRGCSLASSRGYLEVAGTGTGSRSQANLHMSPLCSKYTDQSLLSFCSNLSEMSACGMAQAVEKGDKIREQHRWSDSECCHLAYELHSLQKNAHP